MSNSASPEELTILTETTNLFNTPDANYIIPLYQRAYAWKDKEITQLIEDIEDIDLQNVGYYYLGSLVVYRRGDNSFEVIDGQQRLTTLYLLLNSFSDIQVDKTLQFECRDKSNYTLLHIRDLESTRKDEDRLENQIIAGTKIIKEKFASEKIDEELFKQKLQHVKLYRIEVPKHTDLNRYFEIMNTRGEQLEQQDIVKADLMANIKSESKRKLFAEIWEACSDMNGYVQMHFSVSTRDLLFGPFWGNCPDIDFTKIEEIHEDCSANTPTLKEVIADSFSTEKTDGYNENDERIRFESIIDFRYFLLHALRVYVESEQIKSPDKDRELIDEQLDDKKLRKAFAKVLDYGKKEGSPINKEEFSLGFVKCLVKLRFLFDKYVIKREFTNDDIDGEWSLKTLWGSNRKPYYKLSEFNNYRTSSYSPIRNKDNLMIQACMRVSYTSPKVMHWITKLLKWLYMDNQVNIETISQYKDYTEMLVKESISQYLKNNNYDMGVNTPHIVFNYLDYLLWKRDTAKSFVFEFRNSVEHWYPQHPDERAWSHESGLDYFGNLCLIQREVNAKFSNADPVAKKASYADMIAKGSLKLRIMADLTDSSDTWKAQTFRKHGEEMLQLLRDACTNEAI